MREKRKSIFIFINNLSDNRIIVKIEIYIIII